MKRILFVCLAALMVMNCVFASAETADWAKPYDEPVDIHIVSGAGNQIIFAEGEDWYDNLWWRYFREHYNVNVIVDWVSNEAGTKLNLAIASGDLPDAMSIGIDTMNKMIDAGMLAPLNDGYETCASDTLKRIMERSWNDVEIGMRDGVMYGMPRGSYGAETETSFFWARKDWVEDVGFDTFETLEDVENLMETFREKEGAEYGLVLEKSLDSFYRSASIFKAQPRIWVEGEDGMLVYGSTQPEIKDALAWWAKLYENGYIRPDFAALDTAQSYEDVYNSKTGITCTHQWAGWVYGQDMIKNQGDNTYLIPYDMPKDIDGELVQFPMKLLVSDFNVVRSGYEHPDVLVKLMSAYSYILNEATALGEMTTEEVLPFNTNEMQHVPDAFKFMFPSYDDARDVSHALATGEEVFRSGYAMTFYTECKTWTDDGNPTGLGRYLQMGPGGSVTMACDQLDRGQIHYDALWGTKPQELLDYGSTLDDMLTEGFTEIIMGNETVDYFDTIVENWKAAGGDIVTTAVNEMYGNK